MTEHPTRSPIAAGAATSERDPARTGQRCAECGGRLIADEEHGETVCSECGLVVEEDAIDHGPEWRAFDHQEAESRSRVGSPQTVLMHDNGLSSKIAWQNQDAYGNRLSAQKREKMSRLRKWDERYRTRDSKNRNLRYALGEINRMSSALGLPDTVSETAAVIYRRALSENLLPGRSIEGVATAALYAAARQVGVPRSTSEIAIVSRIDDMEIRRTYRYVARELDLEVPLADPESYVARFAGDLDVSEATERRAHELLQAAKEQAVGIGKSPVGLAAGAVYAGALLTDDEVTQSAVSDVTEISTVTIRDRYRELLKAVDDTPHATR